MPSIGALTMTGEYLGLCLLLTCIIYVVHGWVRVIPDYAWFVYWIFWYSSPIVEQISGTNASYFTDNGKRICM